MTTDERMTLGRVLTEIGSLRTEVSDHFVRLESHLTGQDSRLRLVEISHAAQLAAAATRQAAETESRVSKRFVVTTVMAAVAAMVAATSVVVTIILRVVLPV